MPTIQRSEGNPTWVIEYDKNGLENTQLFRNFLRNIYNLHTSVTLADFRTIRDENNVNLYVYRFDTADGRRWRQTLTRMPTGEFKQTFNVPDGFLETEFSIHRALRQTVTQMVLSNDIKLIRVIWST